MEFIYILGGIWTALLIRSTIKELQFYRTVKNLTPEIWQKMGYHFPLSLPIVFVSQSGKQLIESSSNIEVVNSYRAYKRAGREFLYVVICMLIAAIVFFKLA